MYYNGLGPDEKVYCKHMEEAARRVSYTPKNPNREFYCCKRPQSDKTKCDFWHWVDQVPRATDNPTPVASTSAVQTSSPAPRFSKDGSTRAHPTAATPTRQVQKPPAPLNGPSQSPRSKKRLEHIEAGLKQREKDHSPVRPQAGSSMETGPSTSPSGDQIIPQPPSPVPTEVGCEAETPPRRSFLGLHYSPEPVKSTIQEEDRPATPKKRRLTPPVESAAVQPAGGGIPLGHGLPLTPPQTTRRGDMPRPTSPTMQSRKGKEREGIPPVRNQDQAGPGGETTDEDSLPTFTLPEDATSISSASPTIAENVLDYTDGVKERVKALLEYMESFDVPQATRLLQTIERQKVQYECRDRSQKARMAGLVAEKEKLVAEIAQLKEALRLSEERNHM